MAGARVSYHTSKIARFFCRGRLDEGRIFPEGWFPQPPAPGDRPLASSKRSAGISRVSCRPSAIKLEGMRVTPLSWARWRLFYRLSLPAAAAGDARNLYLWAMFVLQFLKYMPKVAIVRAIINDDAV